MSPLVDNITEIASSTKLGGVLNEPRFQNLYFNRLFGLLQCLYLISREVP